MKRLLLSALVAPLLLLPTGAAAADLVLRSFDISIGIHSPPPRIERAPQVVYVREADHRRDHRHRSHRQENRRGRQEPRVIVIDRQAPNHSCNLQPVVIARPGTRMVVANDRRW